VLFVVRHAARLCRRNLLGDTILLRKIVAIAFIFLCTSAAWMILASTVEYRTYASNDRLKPGIATIWGSPQEQQPPSAGLDRPGDSATAFLDPESSRISVGLSLDYRQKGLLWYSTYAVDFAGIYTFRNPTSDPQTIIYRLKFPAAQAFYDSVSMDLNGQPLSFRADKQGAIARAPLAAGQASVLQVAYRSHGMESWRYKLGDDVSQSRDFQLVVRTNFRQIDFPLDALSPTEKREIPGGWQLTWRYQNVISGFQIGVTLPEKTQPGPLAGEISYFAPVSLLLFFFIIFIITVLRGIDLHPMNYFFLATAFFAFHLLLAYLVDHVSIHFAFVLCSAVSLFLVVSYLRLVIGLRFAIVEAGAAQVVYLVLFSYAFFIPGFAGLAVTIGCIVTLFVVMQLTARIRWSERFTRSPQ
jgi:hypothetical protein